MGCTASALAPLNIVPPEIHVGSEDVGGPEAVAAQRVESSSEEERRRHNVVSPLLPPLAQRMHSSPSSRSIHSSIIVTTGTSASRRSTRSSASSVSMMSPGDVAHGFRTRQGTAMEEHSPGRLPSVGSPCDDTPRRIVGVPLNNGPVVRDESNPAADARIIQWLGSGEMVVSSVDSPTLPTGPSIQIDAPDREDCGPREQQSLIKTPKTPPSPERGPLQAEEPRTTPAESDMWPSFNAITPRHRGGGGGAPNSLLGSASGYGSVVPQLGSASGHVAMGLQSSRRSVTFEDDGIAVGQPQRRRVFPNVALALGTSFDAASPSQSGFAPTSGSATASSVVRSGARPHLTVIPYRSPLDGPPTTSSTDTPRGIGPNHGGGGERRFPRSAGGGPVSRRSSTSSYGLMSPVQSLHLESRTESFAAPSRVDSLFRNDVGGPSVDVDDDTTWAMMAATSRAASVQLDDEQGLVGGAEPLYYQDSPRASPVNRGLTPGGAIV